MWGFELEQRFKRDESGTDKSMMASHVSAYECSKQMSTCLCTDIL